MYHTGTAFYFAAGCAEELQRWLGCLGVATLGIRPDSATPYFSETDDEEQSARPPARAASSGNVSGDQENRRCSIMPLIIHAVKHFCFCIQLALL